MTKYIDCPKCGKKGVKHKAKGLCIKCYKPPKEKCVKCCKLRRVNSRDNKGNPFCGVCYNKNYRPKKNCVICGKLKIIAKMDNNNPICYICYEKEYRSEEDCVDCKKLKKIEERDENNNPICKLCYKKRRREDNEKYAIMCKLRSRLHNAFREFSKTGKIKKSKEYGINYQAIFEHIGVCPGEREKYHIDHILPLSAFNFDDEVHIKAAFAPGNHQWLKKDENLNKSSKYDNKLFEEYLNKFL